MSEDQDLERRRVAYRRAGYAVTRSTQGRPLRAVTLEAADPGRRAGARNWPVDLGSHQRHDLEMEILARWSGLNAEARGCFSGQEPPGGWGDLRAPLAEMGRQVTRSEDENDGYLEWLRRRAAGLLELPGEWEAIEAVAEALLERGRVGESEVSALIMRSLPPPKRPAALRFFYREPR
jgi:hypothetical protein